MATFLFALLVAGISISFMFLFILGVTCAWYAWKKSKVSPSLHLWIFMYVYLSVCIIEYEVSAS